MAKGILGRQPIIDKNGHIQAYELLYRSGDALNSAHVDDDNIATSRVIINAINTFGLEKLTSGKKAFINIGQEFLMSPVIEILPKDSFMLEILETVKITPTVIERIDALRELGFEFAVDDLNLDESLLANFVPIMEKASVFKIDIMQCDLNELEQNIGRFLRYGVTLLAEKVETQEEFDRCKRMGFELFQGYFYAKPNILEKKSIEPQIMSVANMLAIVNSSADLNDIAVHFATQPELTMDLLTYTNSAAIGLRQSISSIEHAVRLLGRASIAGWLALRMYAANNDGLFCEVIMQNVLFRAKLMELTAKRIKQDKGFSDKAYLVGMVSMMDALLQASLDDVMEQINVDDEIRDAVNEHKGTFGALLKAAIMIEKCEHEACQLDVLDILKPYHIDMKIIGDITYECFEWVSTHHGGN